MRPGARSLRRDVARAVGESRRSRARHVGPAGERPHDMTSPPKPHGVGRLLSARGLRAFADGCLSLLVPLYLIDLGMTPFQVGALMTATLLGSGLLTLLVGLQAHRFRSRTLLLCACGVMAATGVGFA